MRQRLESKATAALSSWQRSDPRLKRLCLMDMYLDGTIYDCLAHEYDKESAAADGLSMPRQISMSERKPSTRLGAAKTAARNVARKLFAGRHAPSLICEEHPEAIVKIHKYLREGSVQKEMIGLVVRGSVGSVCGTFKNVEITNEIKLVFSTHRASECFPFFDPSKELEKLYLVREVKGAWFIAQGVTKTFNGADVEESLSYFYVRLLDKNREVFFKPILTVDWNPVKGPFSKLVEIADGPLAPTVHNLGFVQAQWFVNMSGGEFPDGDCLFEPALDNIVTYDYNLSQMDLGLKNAACPVTVLKGKLVQYTDEDGKPIPRPATRYLHFETGTKDPDGMAEEGGNASLLETTGQGFLADLKLLELLKKNISEQISSSRKDPDKVTTAMSGAGIELIEEEFMDLVFELRTCYGEDGYLKLVKKMCLSGIRAGHRLLKGITKEIVEALDLGWPDLHDLSPQDYQQFTAGLLQAETGGVIDQQQAQDLHRAKIDVPMSNARKGSAKPVPSQVQPLQTVPKTPKQKPAKRTKEKS